MNLEIQNIDTQIRIAELIKTEKRGKAGMSTKDLKRLDALARSISDRCHSVGLLAKSARERCRETLAEALLAGKDLLEAKEIMGHGYFLDWLKKHCKGVSESTAQNYMRLAKTQHVGDLKNCASLRQAYITVGILDDSDPEATKPERHAEVHTVAAPEALVTSAREAVAPFFGNVDRPVMSNDSTDFAQLKYFWGRACPADRGRFRDWINGTAIHTIQIAAA